MSSTTTRNAVEAAPGQPASRAGRPRRGWLSGPLPWLLPSVLVLLGISLFPQLYALLNSMRFYNLGVSPEPQGFVGLDNYFRAFGDSRFLEALLRTSIFAVLTTTIQLVLGIAIALLLHQNLRGVRLARTLLIMPVAIAPAVAGLAFRHLYATDGLVTVVLESVGVQLPAEGILGSPDTALLGIMATDIWQWTPFVTLIVLAGLQGVAPEILEASQLDGAGSVRTLWSIILPMLRTVIVTVTLLRFIQTFNIFDIVYVETRGGPGSSTNVLGLDIFYNGLNYYNIGYASALTWIVTVLIAIVINIYLFTAGRRSR